MDFMLASLCILNHYHVPAAAAAWKHHTLVRNVVSPWHNKWSNHNLEIKKKHFQELSLGGGAPSNHVCVYADILRQREGGREGGSSWRRTEGFSRSNLFFLPPDSPGGGRAEQAHTRRSRCARTCGIISAQPAGERSGPEWLIAEQKLLLDDWALCQTLPPANFHFQADFVSAARAEASPLQAHTPIWCKSCKWLTGYYWERKKKQFDGETFSSDFLNWTIIWTKYANDFCSGECISSTYLNFSCFHITHMEPNWICNTCDVTSPYISIQVYMVEC